MASSQVLLVCCAVAVLGGARMLGAQRASDSTGALIVVVRSTDGAPLPYGVVELTATGLERFTDAQGFAAFRGLRAGAVRLRVRHIGYSPADAAETVRAGRADTVMVPLRRLAVKLAGMRVAAVGRCTSPGPPNARTDSAFAAVFEQLRENANTYALLAAQYPFTYVMERTSLVHYESGERVVTARDTVAIGAGLRWHYRPGAVVSVGNTPANHQVAFELPTLPQFADPAFLRAHCFANGGLDTVRGRAVVRVDFAAAASIASPDVSGSIYLDRTTFQIRRSVLRLTRVPEETPQIAAVEVRSDFDEVLPSISLSVAIRSTHTLFAEPGRPVLPDTAYETQRMLRVLFPNGTPGDRRPASR